MFKRTKEQVTALRDDSGLKLEVGKEQKNLEMFLHFPSNASEAASLGLNVLPEPWPGPDFLALSPFPDCCPWCQAGPQCLLAQRANGRDKQVLVLSSRRGNQFGKSRGCLFSSVF